MNEKSLSDPQVVASVIQGRKTLKVLGGPQNPLVLAADVAERNQALVVSCLETAGWAPFHYPRSTVAPREPWRAYLLSHEVCQKIAPKLSDWLPDMKPTAKLPQMMWACGALVLVTWVPESCDEGDSDMKREKVAARNDEHLAASAAMVQNFLLMLTAHGFGTYWSSVNLLRREVFLDHVGMPKDERLVAGVFVEYPDTTGDRRERIPGKLRDARSDQWIREISF
ncbi:MAG: nitroreductase family protein [Acidobacteriota bacterium]